ncbi:MAG: hypothetical protein ACXWCG_01565 [Flavitalea sp.]
MSISTITISTAMFNVNPDFQNAKVQNADRESFRIIKNEFLKINNNVEALHYKAKEMIAYERELIAQKRYDEYSLVFRNKISNDHGLSWARGLLFTLAISIIFYFWYLWTLQSQPFKWGWAGWQSYIGAVDKTFGYFIRFFIITHDLDFMREYKPSSCSFFVDFLGKIFIGYGIYQTVQAFRKHGKT